MAAVPCGIVADCQAPPPALHLPDIGARLDGAILILIIAVAALILLHALIEHMSRHHKPRGR